MLLTFLSDGLIPICDKPRDGMVCLPRNCMDAVELSIPKDTMKSSVPAIKPLSFLKSKSRDSGADMTRSSLLTVQHVLQSHNITSPLSYEASRNEGLQEIILTAVTSPELVVEGTHFSSACSRRGLKKSQRN